jgi:hypothetical protein
MRFVHAAVLLLLSASPALCQRAPEIVVPGRSDVPILMDGVDVSWAVIEGDFGLDRPGEMTPTVIYRLHPILLPYDFHGSQEPGYFPQAGRRPGYGRLEVTPRHRRLPQPAPRYYRSWSADSASASGSPADYPTSPSLNGSTVSPLFNGSSVGPSSNGWSGRSFNGASSRGSFNPVPPQADWPWSDNDRAGGKEGSRQGTRHGSR